MKQLLTALLLTAVFSLYLQAGEFKADLVQSMAGTEYSGKVFIKDQSTRMELSVEGQKAISIVDATAGTVTVLIPEQKMAMKMEFTPDNAAWSDSEDALKKVGATRVKVGEATIAGYHCIQFKISFEDATKGDLIQWFNEELETAVRIEYNSPGGKMVYELKNIVQEPIPAALFTIPADYQVLDPKSMGLPGMMPTP